eukprot:12105712-Heterocapsa_arctica.AAC.1
MSRYTSPRGASGFPSPARSAGAAAPSPGARCRRWRAARTIWVSSPPGAWRRTSLPHEVHT